MQLRHKKLEGTRRDLFSFLTYFRGRLKQLFTKLYPYLSGFYEALFFIYQVLYMYNYTDYFTPFLHLQGLTVQRRTMSDLVYLVSRITPDAVGKTVAKGWRYQEAEKEDRK